MRELVAILMSFFADFLTGLHFQQHQLSFLPV
jgi:hypothetical protein